MPVLTTSNFEDPIKKIEALSCPQHFFHDQGHITPKLTDGQGQDFMAVLATCKFDNDPIKNEDAIVSTTFSPLQVYGKIFRHSRASNSEANMSILPHIELVRDFMPVLVRSKMKVLSCPQHFPHYKSMGAFGCHVNQSSDPICPKTLCSLSPTLFHIKFDQDWPICPRDIHV